MLLQSCRDRLVLLDCCVVFASCVRRCRRIFSCLAVWAGTRCFARMQALLFFSGTRLGSSLQRNRPEENSLAMAD